jgi:ATP-dependent RNA helicase DeaD
MNTPTFKEMGLNSNILRAIEEMDFVAPTEIQSKTIKQQLSEKRDLIALAQTGTGKTAAFGLPIIQQIDSSQKAPQALVLCPTRELCIQLTKDIESYCKYQKGISTVAIYGGSSIDNQLKKLKKGVHIIAATPGRMNDIIRRGKVDLTKIETVVLDEADEMLNMGFQEDLDLILAQTPKEKNTLLFSATMPPEVSKISKKYMRNPYEITAGKKNSGADNVSHVYYMVHAKDRYLALKRIADINPNIYGIVFCRTRAETKTIADKLIQDGYNADALHGDLSQAQRDYAMSKFRNKNLHMLVATDVAARGLDVDDLTHVINYNLPEEMELYTHRSGRTGRAGKSGISIAIINMREKNKIRRIEKMINKKFEKKLVPVGKDICKAQLFNLIDRMKKVDVDQKKIGQFMDIINEKLESFSKESLIKHFVSLEFNRFLEYYKNAQDLNVGVDDTSSNARVNENNRSNSRRRGSKKSNFDRIFINLGKKDKVGPKDLISLVNSMTQDRDIAIGDISSKDKFSFFEVATDSSDVVVEALFGVTVRGRKVRIEKANDTGNSGSERSSKRRTRYSKNQSDRNSRGNTRRRR